MMITFDKKQFEYVNNPEGYSNYVKEREEKEKREKERKQSEKTRAVLKDIDNHDRIQCSKEQATTLVCDGAFIKCSMGTFKSELEIKNESSNTGWIVQKPDFSPEIDNEPSDMELMKQIQLFKNRKLIY